MNISLILILIFISAIYILILKDFRTVTLRTDTTDTPTHRDASHLKIMKPFCLGYISQVMWRLFVTFPRNGAGTCIPHPGPSQQTAQATPSSSLISPAPPNGDPAFAAKVVRAKFCCLQPTGDHNLGNYYCLWLALWIFIFHAI